jgi:putative CocE/NonD family hydrolase
VRAVEELTQAGGNGMQLIGPCAHGGDTPTMTPYELSTWRVLWFDHYLKGVDNGIDSGPAALFYVEGAGLYRYEDEWPIADAQRKRLYLRHAASGTATSLNDGSLTISTPTASAVSVSYSYGPAGPYNSAGGGTTRPTGDQTADEVLSLTWTSQPLPQNTEVTGWPRLHFFASTDAADTDFIVEITEVSTDGSSKTLSRGWLSAARYFDRSNPQPLTPGRIYEFDMELWPLSHVFPAGSRIRVDFAGSDSPGTRPNEAPANVTIYQDTAHPSSLELPVIGTAQMPADQE